MSINTTPRGDGDSAPTQSLRGKLDKLAGDIQSRASEIETMTDLAADLLSRCGGHPTPAHIGHLVNLVDFALGLSREVGDLGERVEMLAREVPEVAA